VIGQAQLLKGVMMESDLAAELVDSAKDVGAVYIANSFTVPCLSISTYAVVVAHAVLQPHPIFAPTSLLLPKWDLHTCSYWLCTAYAL
jgi:hypothetical protein